MNFSISKRVFIRVISFLSAVIVVLGINAGMSDRRCNEYQSALETGYQRAVQDLTSYLSNISLLLQKGTYTASATQLSSLASRIWHDASSAKACLSSLPISGVELDNTYRFLSQVGDYANYLAKKVGNGENITDEETQNFRLLVQHSRELAVQLETLEQNMIDGQIVIGEIQDRTLHADGEMTEEFGRVSDGFEEMEDGFTDFPTLIYDGPFSDHIMQKEPVLTEGLPYISRADARNKAAAALNVAEFTLINESDENSAMPSYCFSTENSSIAVTKQGGFVTYLSVYRDVEEERINRSEIEKRAQAFLEEMGLTSMQETYSEKSGGVCVINYAYRQGEALCYTDLVKVGVALDTGDIVFYEARGYINNHKERELQSPALTLQQAQAKLNTHLEVLSSRLALVPTSGEYEKLCYEFLTQDADGQKVLLYIDAQSGNEEQILILMENENGTMTM